MPSRRQNQGQTPATGVNIIPLGPRNGGSSQNQSAGNPGATDVQTGEGGLLEGGDAPVFISNVAAKAIIDDGGSVPTKDVIREMPGGGYFIKTEHQGTLRQGLDMIARMTGTYGLLVERFPIEDGDDAKLCAGKTLEGADVKARPGYAASLVSNPHY